MRVIERLHLNRKHRETSTVLLIFTETLGTSTVSTHSDKNKMYKPISELQNMIKEKECRYGHVCTSGCQKDFDCPCQADHCCAMTDEGACDGTCDDCFNKKEAEQTSVDRFEKNSNQN